MFKLLVWDCYAWCAWQFFQVKDRKGNYRDIPSNWNQYAGYFPLWRLSYSIIPCINLVGNVTGMVIAEQNWQPMIDAIWENRTVEDYETTDSSTVKTDFMRKWHQNRSGKAISLDEMMENEDGDIFEVADPRGEFEQKVMTAQLPAPSGGKKLPFAAQAEGSFPCPFPCFLRCNSRICAV